MEGISSAPLREPEVKPSELFDGNTDRCGGFLLQCNLAFARSPSLFPSHVSKIIFLVAALKGRALHWAQSYSASWGLLISIDASLRTTVGWPRLLPS
uniref:DUF4939 domain-containing protein n=1 Tax=Kryptolebias marmoratus TaxID=37003 RepID=A0A3Q3AGN7_KRYMA